MLPGRQCARANQCVPLTLGRTATARSRAVARMETGVPVQAPPIMPLNWGGAPWRGLVRRSESRAIATAQSQWRHDCASCDNTAQRHMTGRMIRSAGHIGIFSLDGSADSRCPIQHMTRLQQEVAVSAVACGTAGGQLRYQNRATREVPGRLMTAGACNSRSHAPQQRPYHSQAGSCNQEGERRCHGRASISAEFRVALPTPV